MAVCNVFKKLTKETGTFLTFSQYMEDLTMWQTESKYHRIVPSKFIAIDCRQTRYTNLTLPKYIQEWFENACACFKNEYGEISAEGTDITVPTWTPECSKTLFWNMMLGSTEFIDDEVDPMAISSTGLIDISDVKYVGDINLQSYNEVDSMGYSEIYCHIPNEACAYRYGVSVDYVDHQGGIIRKKNDTIEGFITGEMNGWETLSTIPDGVDYEYVLDKTYKFSWDDEKMGVTPLIDNSFNINMIVVLYDIWNENNVIASGIPMGMYITGLVGEGADGQPNIENSITKYVSNEDIYNAGTSYGLRICSRYVVSPGEDRYIVKDVSVEDNNYGDLSRVLSQLSISQTKMDEVVNKTYNTEQNYKNLLAIFKNSKTNVPYIKVVNNESCWFVNGKLIGPSAVDGVYDSYTNDEMDALLDAKLSQSFQIIATARNANNKYIFERYTTEDIILKWDVYYEGKKIKPTEILLDYQIDEEADSTKYNVSHTNSTLFTKQIKSANFSLSATFGQLNCSTTVSTYFVDPIYFGELHCWDEGVNIQTVTGTHVWDELTQTYKAVTYVWDELTQTYKKVDKGGTHFWDDYSQTYKVATGTHVWDELTQQYIIPTVGTITSGGSSIQTGKVPGSISNNPHNTPHTNIYKHEEINTLTNRPVWRSWFTQEDIKSLPKYIVNTQEQSFSITTDVSEPGHICYAYPAKYGELSYIKDNEGYIYYDHEKVGSSNEGENDFYWSKIKVKPHAANQNDEVEYYVYINKTPTHIDNLTLSFKARAYEY